MCYIILTMFECNGKETFLLLTLFREVIKCHRFCNDMKRRRPKSQQHCKLLQNLLLQRPLCLSGHKKNLRLRPYLSSKLCNITLNDHSNNLCKLVLPLPACFQCAVSAMNGPKIKCVVSSCLATKVT